MSARNRENDTRVQATRDAVVESFNSLFLSRPYDLIQVADVITAAGVGRSTFYEHFKNKDDLLCQSASGILKVLAATATGEATVAETEGVLVHFSEFRGIARAALHGPAAAPLRRALGEQVQARLLSRRRNGGRVEVMPLDLAGASLAEAVLGVIRAWLDLVPRCHPSLLAESAIRLGNAMAGAVFGCRVSG